MLGIIEVYIVEMIFIVQVQLALQFGYNNEKAGF